MEAVGGVASVITVVTLALQSTKVIYEATSSIRHGSDDIDRLARATGNLEKLLEMTRKLAEHAESTNSVAEGKILEDLEPLVEQCAKALGEIPRKLDSLKKDSKDGRWNKVRKYAKVYLDTKGATEMWNTVNSYVEILGTCLAKASVDVGLYNAQELRLFHNELSAASRDNSLQLSHIEDILKNERDLAQAGLDTLQAKFHQESLDARAAATTQIQGMAELRTWQQQSGKHAAVGYQRMADIRADVLNMRTMVSNESRQATFRSKAIMTEVQKGVSEAKDTSSAQVEEFGRMNADVMQKLHNISDRLEAVPSMASEQLSTLQSLIEMLGDMQLGMRTGLQDTANTTISEPYLAGNSRRDCSEMDRDSEIEGIMARICHIANTTRTTRYSKKAQSVIEDIGRLLGLVMQQLSTTSPSRDELPRKRKVLCDQDYSKLKTAVQLQEDLARAKRVLTASERVQISRKDSEQIDECANSGIMLPKISPTGIPRNARQRKSGSGNIQSTTRSWMLRHCRLDAIFRTLLHPDAVDQKTEGTDEEFAAKVLVTPTSTLLSNFQVIVDIASRMNQNRSMYFTPTLTFRAMVPDDSEVFRVVKGGSVRKLKKLLQSGAASLGDCDPIGISLLNVGLRENLRRKMTKFLIQSGADVDTLEPSIAASNWEELGLVKPLDTSICMNDFDCADGDVERIHGCYKLLLDAGSDVSSVRNDKYGGYSWECSAFSTALFEGSLAKVKALVELGEPFVSLESTGDNNPRGTIPLLLLSYNHSMDYLNNIFIPDKTALLLSRAANAKARNLHGDTCLHLALSRHVHREKGCWCEEENILRRYLSETKDIAIFMISAGADVCAVDEEGMSVSDVAIDSGQEIVWTEALKYCGIDIKDVLARPNVDPAHSTALASQYCERPRSVTSKVSLVEYLERRTPFPRNPLYRTASPYLSSSEDDESEDGSLADGSPSSKDGESDGEDLAEDWYNFSDVDEEEIGEDGENNINDKDVANEKTKLD